MSKGRKRADEDRKRRTKWVLVYSDIFRFEEPAVVSKPMDYEAALAALEEAKKREQKECEQYDIQSVVMSTEGAHE